MFTVRFCCCFCLWVLVIINSFKTANDELIEELVSLYYERFSPQNWLLAGVWFQFNIPEFTQLDIPMSIKRKLMTGAEK